MGDKTNIEWTESTWNPVTGCTKVSKGCDHCYAETLAERFRGTPGHYYEDGFDVVLRPGKLDQPLRWQRPRLIFVNSMSDLFHKDVPDSYIAKVFAVMFLADWHTFQLLTKRHGRMRSLLNNREFPKMIETEVAGLMEALGVPGEPPSVEWPLPNLWLGVSVEDQSAANLRVPALLTTPAAVRFLSCEPLLGQVDLDGIVLPPSKDWHPDRYEPTEEDFPGVYNALTDEWWPAEGNADREYAGRQEHRMGAKLDWIIAGGESGPGARPMHPKWVRSLRDQCEHGGVAFHFKQWGDWTPFLDHAQFQSGIEPDGFLGRYGGRLLTEEQAIEDGGSFTAVYRLGKKVTGRALDGRTHDGMPA